MSIRTVRTPLSRDEVSGPSRVLQVPLATELLDEADELGVDVVEACDRGLREAVVKKRRAQEWYQENKDAVDAHNAWVEKHGLILARHRTF